MALSQVITVKQDGAGDFTVIQDAVDAAAQGDTVLVLPAIYYENVDMTDKGIVLAGTWILSQVDSLIHQTIIDGNKQGSCIRSLSGIDEAEIIGLTLRNGNGTNFIPNIHPYLYGSGGGIYLEHSNFTISHCKIHDNFGLVGGGICALLSDIRLMCNTICENWAVSMGGGIRTVSSNIVFDSTQLNNVYLNYSGNGTDIAIAYTDTVDKIWLDTCTVNNPDQYYIGNFDGWVILIEQPPISVLTGKIDQVNADLYISSWGDDTNSGLTADDPLKTISFALLKIASDSLDPKTVHVENGVYSNTLTGEHTPLQLKNHVHLVGQSRDSTIVDCENKYEGARFAFGQDYSMVKNISFYNGNGYPIIRDGGISTGYSKKLVLDGVGLINTTGYFDAGIYSDSDDTLIMTNCFIHHTTGGKSVSIFNKSYKPPRYVEMISSEFSFNYPDTNTELEGRHRTVSFLSSMSGSGFVYAKIINCLFHNNLDSNPLVPVPVPISITASYTCFLTIVNSTFAYNSTTNTLGGAIGLGYGSHATLYNCIFYGNVPNQIVMGNTPDQPSTLGVFHCLIQDGQAGVINFGGYNIVDWGPGNLDANPMFLGTEEYPYALDYGSPCIDAGTMSLPPGITLPEYDIAGNPRVWGASVDMGAYEYGPWVSVPEARSSKFKVQSAKLMTVSPNPFRYGTYISYELKEKGRLNISVFTMSGMKIKTLIHGNVYGDDKGSFYWDGCDQDGQALSAGVYLIRMTLDGKVMETVKAVKR